MRNLKIFVYMGVFILLLSSAVMAGTGTSVGLGGGSSASSGPVGFEKNPATMGAEKGVFHLSIQPFSGTINTNALSTADYLKYADSFIDEDDKDYILGSIPDTGLRFGNSIQSGISLRLGSIGVRAGASSYGNISLDRDIFDLILKGNELNRAYKLNNTWFEAAIYGKVGASASLGLPVAGLAEALNVQSIHIGAAFDIIEGGLYTAIEFEGEGFESIWSEDEAKIIGEATAIARYSTKGEGTAMGAGLLVQLDDATRIGVSVTNIGSIKWEDTTELIYNVTFDSKEEEFEADEVSEEILTEPLAVDLPRHFNAGIERRISPMLLIDAGYSSITYASGHRDTFINAGVEFAPLRFIPLYMGIKYSPSMGSTSFSGGTALDLGLIKLDIGFSDLKVIGAGTKNIEAAISTSIKF